MIELIIIIVVALMIFSILKELAPFALIVFGVGWVLYKIHGG